MFCRTSALILNFLLVLASIPLTMVKRGMCRYGPHYLYRYALHKGFETCSYSDSFIASKILKRIHSKLIMHYSGRSFPSTPTFAALQTFSHTGWIPSRHLETTPKHDGLPSQVRMPDLGDLANYVAPILTYSAGRRLQSFPMLMLYSTCSTHMSNKQRIWCRG